ncbi:hypothetical protein DVH05_009204 [Phytophthora capsici]|nr:hypothetical protein DVH05_009204 [Phytophthora capsici]
MWWRDIFCEAKAVAAKIVDRMALQSTPTFRVALKWLQDFYAALQDGDVVDFADQTPTVFPGLSQVSSVSGARLSQMSFGETGSPVISSTRVSSDEAVEEDIGLEGDSNETKSPAGDRPDPPNPQEVGTSESNQSGRLSARTESAQKPTETTPNSTGKGKVNAVSWTFAERPIVNGLTKAQRKRAKTKEDAAKTRERAEVYRNGTLLRFVTFDEVAAPLDCSYSFYYSKAMVDALVIPNVEVHGELTVKPFAVAQDVPQITNFLNFLRLWGLSRLSRGRPILI